jgi:hypothetical protein
MHGFTSLLLLDDQVGNFTIQGIPPFERHGKAKGLPATPLDAVGKGINSYRLVM